MCVFNDLTYAMLYTFIVFFKPTTKSIFGKNRYKETHPIYNGNIVSLVVKFMPSKHVSRVRFPNGVYFCASMA